MSAAPDEAAPDEAANDEAANDEAANDEARPIRRAFVGLGSNLGDRRAELVRAVAALRSHGDLVAVSPLYETDPVGGPAGQPAYLNLVVELCTRDSARALLERCAELEAAAHRVRTVRFGPRTLDADVLLVGDEHVDEPGLTVPHPRMWDRRFVLAPLRDLAPDLVSADMLARAGGEVRQIGTL
ncbi:MAG TPA: 2-amino-4-hydroxy-6-hydroxymethyldihydropteridine diphosphokinase [Acidimicrobiales bacterium]|jgi:2-amino-4-hydroxy-6-hydroxymethyldihydropteridine diphosphokinase|nr:2-amino-4-hydroxy-6-hydroxymethyldihydropteridine diphosphokinase [Acidimicrobiales bacterium]